MSDAKSLCRIALLALAASPPEGNPLYWPRVGSCSEPLGAGQSGYYAVLMDSEVTSTTLLFTFGCGTGGAPTALVAGGGFASPGPLP
jgi:hypothetical protein